VLLPVPVEALAARAAGNVAVKRMMPPGGSMEWTITTIPGPGEPSVSAT
jgi:hypothetical protein